MRYGLLAGCMVANFLLSSIVLADYFMGTAFVKGELATALPGWPEGVLKLINDPLRGEGRNGGHAECSNDDYDFGMEVSRPEDVVHLIEILAAIDTETVRICLDPGEGAAHFDGAGAMFSLGNQEMIDNWYNSFLSLGQRKDREPPVAAPPTLLLFVKHKAIDLKTLEVPVNIEVSNSASEPHRKLQPEACREIDDFVSAHKLKQEQALRAKR